MKRAIFRILGLFLGMMSLGKKHLFLGTWKCHSSPPPSPITLIPIFLDPKIGGGGLWPQPNRGRWVRGGGGGACHLMPYIYYYTPLPLSLANKQQASNKQASNNKQQALLLSVLAIAPPHRSGLYSTLAILEPRWWPCQIQVLSQKLTGGAPGRGRQVRRCPPKSAQFLPQNSLFLPEVAPKPGQNAQTKGNGGYIPRAA